jgi:hypothetical protein
MNWRLEGPHYLSGYSGEEKSFLHLPDIKYLALVAHTLITILAELSCLLMKNDKI